MENILTGILSCEEEAFKLQEDAKKQSLEIIAEARKKAADLLEKSLAEGEALVDSLIQQAKKESLEELKRQEALASDQGLKAIPKQKLDDAVDFIVESVVNNPWQW